MRQVHSVRRCWCRLVAVVAGGCSESGSDAATCVPGKVRACRYSNGATGTQTCSDTARRFDAKAKKGPFDTDTASHVGPVVLSRQPPISGTGRFIDTTFHNGEQADQLMTKILNSLVFVL